MVDNKTLEQDLLAYEDVIEAQVTGDGYHYQLIIVSDAFVGLSLVKRQQWVYAKINHYINSGQLHAVNMQTYTLQEWEKRRG